MFRLLGLMPTFQDRHFLHVCDRTRSLYAVPPSHSILPDVALYQGHIIVVGSHFLRWPNQKGYRIALALRLLLEFDQSLLATETPWLALLVVSTDATCLSSHLVLSLFAT